tara:strand:- start:324 stop:635 length:312 start_codon:yes stop_codon:yes gene_type:complete
MIYLINRLAGDQQKLAHFLKETKTVRMLARRAGWNSVYIFGLALTIKAFASFDTGTATVITCILSTLLFATSYTQARVGRAYLMVEKTTGETRTIDSPTDCPP